MSGKVGQGDREIVKKAAKLRAQGRSVQDIAKRINRCRDTTYRILKTDEAREIMQRCHSAIMDKAPKAVDNILGAVDDFADAYAEGNKVRAGIAWEATKLVTQIPGITPAAQVSIVHQTFINQQNNILDPTISSLIDKYLGSVLSLEDPNIIEAEVEAV
jgi:hypothetical protein